MANERSSSEDRCAEPYDAASDESDAKKLTRVAAGGERAGKGAGGVGGAPVFVVSDETMEDALNLPLGTRGRSTSATGGVMTATPCIVKVYDDEVGGIDIPCRLSIKIFGVDLRCRPSM